MSQDYLSRTTAEQTKILTRNTRGYFAYCQRDSLGTVESTAIASSTTYYSIVSSISPPDSDFYNGFDYIGNGQWENTQARPYLANFAISGTFGHTGGIATTIAWRISIGLWDGANFVVMDASKYIGYTISGIANTVQQGVIKGLTIPVGGIVAPIVYRASGTRDWRNTQFNMSILPA